MRFKRIVVMMKAFLGDAVMTTPLIDGLLESGAEVTLVTSEAVFGMVSSGRQNLSMIPFIRHGTLSDVRREASALRKLHFDAAILVNRSFRSAMTARLAGIRICSGHAVDRRGWLLSHRLPYDKEKSEVECYLELARQIGLPIASRHPELRVTEVARHRGANLLQGATVAIQPGASAPWKRIPPPILAEVVAKWNKAGRTVAILGGSDEVTASKELLALCGPGTRDLVGSTDIVSSMGILSNLELMLGGDTGLMHVAAGVGCRTVTVFANQRPSKWGHFYIPHTVLQAPDGDMQKFSLSTIDPYIRLNGTSPESGSPEKSGAGVIGDRDVRHE